MGLLPAIFLKTYCRRCRAKVRVRVVRPSVVEMADEAVRREYEGAKGELANLLGIMREAADHLRDRGHVDCEECLRIRTELDAFTDPGEEAPARPSIFGPPQTFTFPGQGD